MYYSAIEEPKSKDRATDEGTGQNRKKICTRSQEFRPPLSISKTMQKLNLCTSISQQAYKDPLIP